MSLAWGSSKLQRVARSSSAAEVQAAATAQEEAEYVRLVVHEVLHGAFDLKTWQQTCAKVPGALIIDCKGVFDALQSESSALGMSDRRSALEALGLRQALRATCTDLRWVHSGAQLADVLTKDTKEAKRAWELLVKRGFWWKLTYDPRFVSYKNRQSQGVSSLLQ